MGAASGGAISARWLRCFEDGAAVFDPVSWQTHILSSDGLKLLAELVEMVHSSGARVETVLADLRAENEIDEGDESLRAMAQLACHLVQGAPRS